MIAPGKMNIHIVGLPDKAVAESRERVQAALHASGLSMPSKKVTVNLAPADLPKEGSHYDLPIALGLMAALGAIPGDALSDYVVLGELSLDGSIRPVRGALSMAVCARNQGIPNLVLPADNAAEAAVVDGLNVYGARHLAEVVEMLSRPEEFSPAPRAAVAIDAE